MFSKFTVLACYCIYFSKSQREYEDMLGVVCKGERTDLDINEQIDEASKVAQILMQPYWAHKRKRPYIIDDIKRLNKKFEQDLKKELRQAKYDHQVRNVMVKN
ncbi:hypothetical protein LCGC14_2890550 [marine sediment metagenome]|uniref:Uncharacterized protein n=1 Tax=marine sediment metagenome TaxID=412755 RepID=A0A0F8XXC4_9ZZZZ